MKLLGRLGRLVFPGAELVEVVVMGDFLKRILLLGGAERAFADIFQFGGKGSPGRRQEFATR